MERPPVAVVFGARTSGRAVVAERLAAGWRALAAARSEETLERLRAEHPEALTMVADARDPASVEAVLGRAQRELGGLELVVNAVGGGARGGPFGGGPLIEAPADRLDGWVGGFLPAAFHVLRLGGRELAARGAGTIIQLAGGSARRGMPGRGPWAAAQFATRGMVQALAQELRPQGVHAALLVIDGAIQSERNPMAGRPTEDSVAPEDVARAVAYLTDQSPRGWTHELVVTPAGDAWVP
jgi:NAD(P)-dependent dehydrogenase (short-subunit alcohol dehydrogenase family)